MKWLRKHLPAIFIAITASATAAYAASSALSGLSAASSVAGTDLFYDVQTNGVGGVKATAAQLAAYEATVNGFGYPAAHYLTSNWYTGNILNPSTGAQALAANTVYCAPGWVTSSVTIKALGIYVTTSVAGSNAQMAVYSESGGTLTLVDSTANVATTTSTSGASQTVANTTDVLSAGVLYFFCANDDHTVTLGATGNVGLMTFTIGSATLGPALVPQAGGGLMGIKWTATLGTWAGTEALSSTTAVTNTSGVQVPLVAFQVN